MSCPNRQGGERLTGSRCFCLATNESMTAVQMTGRFELFDGSQTGPFHVKPLDGLAAPHLESSHISVAVN